MGEGGEGDEVLVHDKCSKKDEEERRASFKRAR
jgi:hypothetical protein